jgi:hypothetical protein
MLSRSKPAVEVEARHVRDPITCPARALSPPLSLSLPLSLLPPPPCTMSCHCRLSPPSVGRLRHRC